MTKPPIQQSITGYPDTVFLAGITMAIGAMGIFVASVFYALAPVAAALPIPNVSLANTIDGLRTGRTAMITAGTIAIISDVIAAAGTLMLMAFRNPAGLQIERAGWALMTISVLLFTTVDSLAAGVLTQVAALERAEPVLGGFKLLFDTLFILGTISFGVGGLAIFVSEMRSESPVLARPLIWVGILDTFVGLVSGLLYLANVSLPQVIGSSIAGGVFIFAIYGVQIARSAR